MITILTKYDLIPPSRKKKIEDINLSDFLGFLFNTIVMSTIVVLIKNKQFIFLKDRHGFGQSKSIFPISELTKYIKEENDICSSS